MIHLHSRRQRLLPIQEKQRTSPETGRRSISMPMSWLKQEKNKLITDAPRGGPSSADTALLDLPGLLHQIKFWLIGVVLP